MNNQLLRYRLLVSKEALTFGKRREKKAVDINRLDSFHWSLVSKCKIRTMTGAKADGISLNMQTQ